MQGSATAPQIISYFVGGAILLIVMTMRFRSVGRQRRLKLERLWVVPAILATLMILAFVGAPPSPLTLGLCGVVLLIGAGIGWQRGRMMQIHVDPQTHELSQTTSLAAMLFLLAIIAFRFGAGALMQSGVLPVHVNPVAMSDVLLSFALGMFGVTRLEMFLRARRMLAGARAKA